MNLQHLKCGTWAIFSSTTSGRLLLSLSSHDALILRRSCYCLRIAPAPTNSSKPSKRPEPARDFWIRARRRSLLARRWLVARSLRAFRACRRAPLARCSLIARLLRACCALTARTPRARAARTLCIARARDRAPSPLLFFKACHSMTLGFR